VRRIILAFMSTVAAVVLLFGYRTSTPAPALATTAVAAAGSGGSSTGSTTTTPDAPSSTAGSTKNVTGQTAQTRWGPVQVQLTVTAAKVTAVTVLQQPSGNGRDVEINNAALPVLKQETLQAQSAQIDSVSGATVTSDGYLTSLQSALDQAGL